MSFRHEGLTCSVCHAYLFEEDDVVYCPECGAPHHRDCYNSVGHCALADKHGTDEQYDVVLERTKAESEFKEKESKTDTENQNDTTCAFTVCDNCKNRYPSNKPFCPECGASKTGGGKTSPISEFPGITVSGFDFLGGVPADMDLGKGVTADEAKRFVMANTHRYIPKFAAMQSGSKTSWNWFAFLFPPVWFISRKMYKNGILSGVLMIALTLLTFPFLNSMNSIDTSSARNYLEIVQIMSENISVVGIPAFVLACVGSVGNLLLRLFSGLFADYSYRNHTLNTVADIKADSSDINSDMRKKGGTSFLGLIISLLAIEYLPSVILMFIR